MRILVIGAGVIGSLFGAKLAETGNEVTVLARGRRLEEVQQHGLVLEDALTGRKTVARVGTMAAPEASRAAPAAGDGAPAPNQAYDLALVTVRRDQLDGVLPALVAKPDIPLFMVNNPGGYAEVARAIGAGRVVVGFPGAGGTKDGPVIRYAIVPALVQTTTVGELDGRITPRLRKIARTLRRAGFRVALSRNMDAWQKSHVALVSPIASAIYMAEGDPRRLAAMPEGIRLMLRAVREGFRALAAQGVPVTPWKLRSLQWLPEGLLAPLAARLFRTRLAEVAFAAHANAARGEMAQLAEELEALVRRAGRATPALDRLSRYSSR